MSERNGADVVREYMASQNNPMRVLIREWRKVPNHRKDSDLRADELEAALADTGELVSRIDYLWMTQRAEIRHEAFEEAAKAAETAPIQAIGEGAIRIRVALKIRALQP